MDEAVELDIANDFSRFPSGRDEIDGPNNGVRFREQFLEPKFREAVSKRVPLIVRLDGVLSFGSSFLEEAFGGLVRVHKISRGELEKTLQIAPGWIGNDRYRSAIMRYIQEAKA